MNPFSQFLQPATQRPLDFSGGADVVRTVQEGRNFKQRQLENTQSNDRANSRLAMEKAYQDRKFSEEDQKQQEALLAEYHDAKDTGDPVRQQRAEEMLKRFGIDVQQSGPPPANLRAFTGQDLLPSVPKAKPNAEASEKPFQNPIDQAVETEQASREALREKNEAPLSQEDAEAKLIADAEANPAPERMETPEGTTPEARAYLDKAHPAGPDELPPPTRDMGDVDSPQFRAAAKNEVMDLDEGRPPQQIGQPLETTSQAPQAAAALPPRLPGQLLPTIISKGGKVLESSSGQAGRYSPMVAAVFEPYTRHQNPEIADAAKRAQALAGRLSQVDGITPRQAIDMAKDQLTKEMGDINQLERTKIGSRAHVLGSGKPGTGLMGKTQDIAESARVYAKDAQQMTQKLQDEDNKYAVIEASVNSGQVGPQKDAINQLLQVRSGTAVTASEDNRIMTLNGMIDRLANQFNTLRGAPMTSDMIGTLKQIVALKRQISAAKIQRIYDYQSRLYEAQNTGKISDPEVLKKRAALIREGGSVGAGTETTEGDDISHLWE